MSRAARCLAAATGALLLCAPTALEAQRAPTESSRGWLGIGLRETIDCPSAWPGPVANRRRDCSSVFVVRAVFQSSPAQRAGVAPGDTLLEIAGARLGTEAATDRLRALRPGEQVGLLLGREGGRRSVTVTPAPRPPAPGPPVAVRVGSPEAPGRVSVAVRPRVTFGSADSVFRVELPEAPEVVFGTEHLEGIRVDDQGRVFLERGGEQLIRLRQLERMAPRLRAVSDSALAMARERLRAVRAEIRREERDDRSVARAWGPSGPHRALGAELWTVSPELARSLRNVDHGLLVLKVLPGTPAAELGLRGGDVLVRVGGSAVRTPQDLRGPFDAPGDASVAVRWIREGEAMTDTLRLGG